MTQAHTPTERFLDQGKIAGNPICYLFTFDLLRAQLLGQFAGIDRDRDVAQPAPDGVPGGILHLDLGILRKVHAT
jgi:hypothetical protein